MDGIVSQVRRVSDLINEITSATREQTSGIGQISDAVSQLDQVTQQNAALVEESAAAADSLNQQVSQLVRAVAVFKLDHQQAHAQPAAAPPPRLAVGVAARAPTHRLPRQAPAPTPALTSARARGNESGDWTTF
jgi:methyl-accepting chemotaxis protein